ncbi:hypothetical protein ACFWP7_20675 [Streptomyces sp. NPDC058470]|uniref:hypothetical protein n=1 Tax=Streptomyces sp. NPDC058470 TaxID=3346515 RepID=UPI00365FC981
MYGHGAAPPSRSSGTVITLRVLIAAAGFLTCGLLACVPLFRVAVLRGKWFDWALAWVSLPLAIGGLAVIGSLPEEDARTDVALAVILLLGAFASVHFLIADIQHHRQGPPFPGYIPQRPPVAGYGYPQAASPYAATHSQTPIPPTPAPHTAVPPHTPVPPHAPPQRPAPARIDQVRAELDELSDYLRKHESNPEDGR